MTVTTTSRKSASARDGGLTSRRSRKGSGAAIPCAGPVAAVRPRTTPSEEELLAKYEPRIRGLAHRLMPRLLPTITPEDLMQAGRIALVRVARRYDPSKGTPFGGYLQQRLRGAMLDLLEIEYARFHSAPRDGQWNPALTRRVHSLPNTTKIADETAGEDEGFLTHIPDPGTINPESAAAHAKLSALLSRAGDEVLTVREKIILSALFVRGMTLEQAGELVGLGESRVCQIRAEILLKLKSRLRSYGVNSLGAAIL